MAPEASSVKRALGVALAGVALTLVAFMFDAAPLFVPGIAFAAVGLAAPAWVWLSARGASVHRHLDSERVVEDQPVSATIEVRRSRLGFPGGEVVDPLAGTRLSLTRCLSLVGGADEAHVRVIARFPRRGIHQVQPPSLIVRDPLELARVVIVSSAPARQLLVLPRTEPVNWLVPDNGARSDSADGRVPADALAAVDLDGLRPYRPGTPASRIHWPAVARGAGLIERRLQPDSDDRPLVVLDARGDGPPELLDAAVRAAASLALELARLGGCGLLLPGERRATTISQGLANWPAAHARLALVEGGPDTRAPALGAARARVGAVFYVASQPFERVAAAVLGVTSGAGMLVLPAVLSEGPFGARAPASASFEVAGCRGFRLGARRGARRDAGAGPQRATVA